MMGIQGRFYEGVVGLWGGRRDLPLFKTNSDKTRISQIENKIIYKRVMAVPMSS